MLIAEAGLAGLDQALARIHTPDLPLMLIGGKAVGAPDAVDRLDEPWSVEYARTRIRTWLLRTEPLWARPPIPVDEDARIEALHALDILDTPPEERFDRHTRLAAALLHAPISLITLIDSDRQWFKSCFGTCLEHTPREVSFCAHAVAARATLVISDMLLDARFREHPLVVSDPHVRFYAGAVIYAPGGQPIGTLCVVDTRPHVITDEQRELLADLAAMVGAELARVPELVRDLP
jgi:GAF domain-containing protein